MGAELGKTAATLFTIGLVFISIGIPVIVFSARRWRTVLYGFASVATGVIFVLITIVIVATGSITQAFGRDLDGRYANSPLKAWMDSLRSGKGACCSDADGKALADVDWETKDGHYRVRIEGQWWDVPDETVITEPNHAGRTMVWPIYYHSGNPPVIRVEIRCFMPGPMT